MNYRDFCNKNEDIILDEIDDTIKSLNLPKHIETQILSIIYDESHTILEERYADFISSYEDIKYDELKDSRDSRDSGIN